MESRSGCCGSISFFFYCSGHRRDLHSFPTRRSSDLLEIVSPETSHLLAVVQSARDAFSDNRVSLDRKSTRLNSSHMSISYAVFCLKKKKKKQTITPLPTVHSLRATTAILTSRASQYH